MKNSKKVMLAALMLFVAIVLVSTTSYAWFSRNNQVSAQGMELTAAVPTNLIISTDKTTWNSGVIFRLGNKELTPVSSVNGCDGTFYSAQIYAGVGDFYGPGATVNATAVTAEGNGGETYYIDTPLYLKLQADSGTTMKVKLSNLSVYNESTGAKDGLANAYRVAIFEGTLCTTENLLYFITVDPEEDYLVYPIVSTTSVSTTPAKAVANGPITVGTFEKTLTVRIWVEGQDKYCLNEYATDTVAVSLTFTEAE